VTSEERLARLLALPPDELEAAREFARVFLRAEFGRFYPSHLVDRRAADLLDDEGQPRERYL
jgi:hypothetical protein